MNEGAVNVLIALGILVAVFAVVIAVLSARDKRRLAMLRRIAARFGGTAFGARTFGEPWIELTLAGRKGRLEFDGGGRYSQPWTRVTIDGRGVSPGTLHILKEGFGQMFLKLFGAQDISIGDPAFDRTYVIKATPESLARRLFSPERMRNVIGTVRRLEEFTDPTFDLDLQVITVRVRDYLTTELALVNLIEAAQAFCGFLLQEPQATDIVLAEVQVVSAAACPVCGTPMTQGVVRCESCRTPHHGECWTYMGRCSTYACKGRRLVA